MPICLSQITLLLVAKFKSFFFFKILILGGDGNRGGWRETILEEKTRIWGYLWNLEI